MEERKKSQEIEGKGRSGIEKKKEEEESVVGTERREDQKIGRREGEEGKIEKER